MNTKISMFVIFIIGSYICYYIICKTVPLKKLERMQIKLLQKLSLKHEGN